MSPIQRGPLGRLLGGGGALAAMLAATLVVLAAPAAAANAQARVQCAECSAEARKAAEEQTRELRTELRTLRKEVARLERTERDDGMKRVLRETASALEDLDPAARGAQGAVSRALTRVSMALASPEVNGDRYGRLVGQLAELQGEMASASARATIARTMAAVRVAKPVGWLGVAYSGDPTLSDRERGPYFYFRDYPVIASVDPGSPAEGAGLEAGDTIVAFGGRDVRRRRIYHSDVLKPGSRLQVRVRRGGNVRNTRVAVKARPSAGQIAQAYVSVAPSAAPSVRVRSGTRVTITSPDGRVRTIRPGTPPAAPAAPVAPVAPVRGATPAAPGLFLWSSGPSAVAGAELARMNDDLRDALGVESGVLVLSVGRGTPAAEAGLRAGDVILRAGGRSVTSPARVQRAVGERSDNRRVELDVVRKGERRRVVMRW